MIARRQDGPAPAHHAVQAPRQAEGEGTHPDRGHPLVTGLHDEMEVIALHGEVDDPEARPRTHAPQRRVEDAERALAPEVPDVGGEAHRDVQGMVRPEALAAIVVDGLAVGGGACGPRPCACRPSRGGRGLAGEGTLPLIATVAWGSDNDARPD